jgi:putative endonuclease
MWTVYILKCNDATHYTGCTENLEARLKQHNKGEVSYTRTKLPFELITTINFSVKFKAFAFEKYLKSGSGKAFANKRLL